MVTEDSESGSGSGDDFSTSEGYQNSDSGLTSHSNESENSIGEDGSEDGSYGASINCEYNVGGDNEGAFSWKEWGLQLVKSVVSLQLELHPALADVEYKLGDAAAFLEHQSLANSEVAGALMVRNHSIKVLHLCLDERECNIIHPDYGQKVNIKIMNENGVKVGDIFGALTEK